MKQSLYQRSPTERRLTSVEFFKVTANPELNSYRGPNDKRLTSVDFFKLTANPPRRPDSAHNATRTELAGEVAYQRFLIPVLTALSSQPNRVDASRIFATICANGGPAELTQFTLALEILQVRRLICTLQQEKRSGVSLYGITPEGRSLLKVLLSTPAPM